MKTLVVDIGGTNIKALATGRRKRIKFPSGPEMTPEQMVRELKVAAADWTYNRVSIGYPGPVVDNHPNKEPHNLAPGWVDFDYEKAFGCPVKMINDAAMQAYGSYDGGRMLFLGLGTGLGSALVIDNVIHPLELAHLPYKNSKSFEDYLGIKGLKKSGKKKWRKDVAEVVPLLRFATQTDYVVLGGGNSSLIKELPERTTIGHNSNAFQGGYKLWTAGG
ncbi:MAG: ROK family protein [Verrucomicrobiota bacterium]